MMDAAPWHKQSSSELKSKKFDLRFNGQSHSDLILVCDTLPCPNAFM